MRLLFPKFGIGRRLVPPKYKNNKNKKKIYTLLQKPCSWHFCLFCGGEQDRIFFSVTFVSLHAPMVTVATADLFPKKKKSPRFCKKKSRHFVRWLSEEEKGASSLDVDSINAIAALVHAP